MQMRLTDDTRTDGLGAPGSVKTKLLEDPLMPSHRDEKEVRVHPDQHSSRTRFPVGNLSHSVIQEANSSNALGQNRIHDAYSLG